MSVLADLDTERFLVLGDPALQFPGPRDESLPFVVVPLASGRGSRATELLSADEVTAGESVALLFPDEDRWVASVPVSPGLVPWAGTSIGAELGRAIRTWLIDARHEPVVDRLAPLAILRVRRTGERPGMEVLACGRLRAGGAIFTRIHREDVSSTEQLSSIVGKAITTLPEGSRPHVVNDDAAYVNLSRGIELETKLVLTGRSSAWSIATRLSSIVGAGDLAGFVPDLGNEFQRWQTHQQTWEVLSPPGEEGYLALMHNGSGQRELKRKRFTQDGLRRRETFRTDLPLDPAREFDQQIRELYPELVLRSLPSHRRAKFDVNVESVETGHFFGIETDVVVVDGTGVSMSQLEVEYHRSRVHDGLSAEAIEPELLRLTGVVERLLGELGETPVRTYYSKLSFLRDLLTTGSSPYSTTAEPVRAV